jgi:hypothetical protein
MWWVFTYSTKRQARRQQAISDDGAAPANIAEASQWIDALKRGAVA